MKLVLMAFTKVNQGLFVYHLNMPTKTCFQKYDRLLSNTLLNTVSSGMKEETEIPVTIYAAHRSAVSISSSRLQINQTYCPDCYNLYIRK